MKHLRFMSCLLAVCLLSISLYSGAYAATCYIGCDECTGNAQCSACAFCIAVTATARPSSAQAIPRPVATARPVFTPRPTAGIITPRPTASVAVKPPASNGDYTTISLSKQEEIVFQLLNLDRQRNGLPALVLDAELSRIARIKSQDMKDNRYFAHESPTYGRAAQMLTHFGYPYNGVGENIAHHATVEKAQAAFLSSPAHRLNIMGRQWQKVGIGVVYDAQGFVYVTQLFVR